MSVFGLHSILVAPQSGSHRLMVVGSARIGCRQTESACKNGMLTAHSRKRRSIDMLSMLKNGYNRLTAPDRSASKSDSWAKVPWSESLTVRRPPYTIVRRSKSAPCSRMHPKLWWIAAIASQYFIICSFVFCRSLQFEFVRKHFILTVKRFWSSTPCSVGAFCYERKIGRIKIVL